jgi:hypothetical protein
MIRRRTGSPVVCLDGHPNRPEILAVLARIPHLTDCELRRLAAVWRNTEAVGEARSRALQPDSPLVVEVLVSFDAVQSLFVDDTQGADYVTVSPEVATVALKAVRDAIAGAYARPALGRPDHAALLAPWRAVFPVDDVDETDLGGRAGQVKALLSALPRLATRCHDAAAAREYAALRDACARVDEDVRSFARDDAWQAAVLTSRRRVWSLVRRNGVEGMGRFCPQCRTRADGDEAARVLQLCLDAACGLLVADAIDETLLDSLTGPVRSLIPAQRAVPN